MSIHGWSELVPRPATGWCVKQYGHAIGEPDWLIESAKQDPLLNPGAAWVSNLSAEPVVFRDVLDDLVRPAQEQGLLSCLMRHRPVDAAMVGDQMAAVTVQDSYTSENVTITASYVLDATDEGDLHAANGVSVDHWSRIRRDYR